jgi:arginyl-tRNA synthetase
MQKIKEQLAELLNKAGFEVEAKDFVLPPDAKMGDLALPCFNLAKQRKVAPAEVVQLILKQVQDDRIEKVAAAGPYVNFVFDRQFLFEQILCSGCCRDEIYLVSTQRAKTMVEYSQPNTHKEFHVGHLRNACLGAAIVNLLRATGNKVIAANYIGDTGTHVAKCLWYLEKNNPSLTIDPAKNKAAYLGEIYAAAAKLLDENKELAAEVSDVQKRLESGDKALLKLWKKTKKWSMEDFERIYSLLNNKFVQWFWESEEEREGKKLLEKIVAEGKIQNIKRSDGALIADLREFGLDVLVLIKSDGSALYGAKDLPLGIKKFKKFKVDKSIYIVDKRQTLYLKQIFKLLDLLGFSDREKIHVGYDFVTLPEGAMASRKGNVVTFDKLFDEVFAKALSETKTRHENWSAQQVANVAKKIALAAIKFWMLKYENSSVIVFDIDKAIAFDGDTGPYLLYTIARVNSLLSKARENKIKPAAVSLDALAEDIERELVLKIGVFADAVKKAADSFEPIALSKYLLELAQLFNNFYHKCPVVSAERDLAKTRLFLANRVKDVLTKGLELLNIEIVEEM